MSSASASTSGDTQIFASCMSAGPGAAVYHGKLYVFHQGYGDSGDLKYTTFERGSWSSDTLLAAKAMSGSPSPVVFHDKLYVFYQGYGGSGVLHYNIFNGNAWAGQSDVGSINPLVSPSAVVYDEKLYVFYQASTGVLSFNTFNGRGWLGESAVPNAVSMGSDPSAVVGPWKDGCHSLYVFYQGAAPTASSPGVDGSGKLFYNVFDGANWQADVQVTITGLSVNPSAVLYGHDIYVFYQGYEKDGVLCYDTLRGSSWAGEVETAAKMSAGPGSALFEGKVYSFHQGYGLSGALSYITLTA